MSSSSNREGQSEIKKEEKLPDIDVICRTIYEEQAKWLKDRKALSTTYKKEVEDRRGHTKTRVIHSDKLNQLSTKFDLIKSQSKRKNLSHKETLAAVYKEAADYLADVENINIASIINYSSKAKALGFNTAKTAPIIPAGVASAIELFEYYRISNNQDLQKYNEIKAQYEKLDRENSQYRTYRSALFVLGLCESALEGNKNPTEVLTEKNMIQLADALHATRCSYNLSQYNDVKVLIEKCIEEENQKSFFKGFNALANTMIQKAGESKEGGISRLLVNYSECDLKGLQRFIEINKTVQNVDVAFAHLCSGRLHMLLHNKNEAAKHFGALINLQNNQANVVALKEEARDFFKKNPTYKKIEVKKEVKESKKVTPLVENKEVKVKPADVKAHKIIQPATTTLSSDPASLTQQLVELTKSIREVHEKKGDKANVEAQIQLIKNSTRDDATIRSYADMVQQFLNYFNKGKESQAIFKKNPASQKSQPGYLLHTFLYAKIYQAQVESKELKDQKSFTAKVSSGRYQKKATESFVKLAKHIMEVGLNKGIGTLSSSTGFSVATLKIFLEEAKKGIDLSKNRVLVNQIDTWLKLFNQQIETEAKAAKELEISQVAQQQVERKPAFSPDAQIEGEVLEEKAQQMMAEAEYLKVGNTTTAESEPIPQQQQSASLYPNLGNPPAYNPAVEGEPQAAQEINSTNQPQQQSAAPNRSSYASITMTTASVTKTTPEIVADAEEARARKAAEEEKAKVKPKAQGGYSLSDMPLVPDRPIVVDVPKEKKTERKKAASPEVSSDGVITVRKRS